MFLIIKRKTKKNEEKMKSNVYFLHEPPSRWLFIKTLCFMTIKLIFIKIHPVFSTKLYNTLFSLVEVGANAVAFRLRSSVGTLMTRSHWRRSDISASRRAVTLNSNTSKKTKKKYRRSVKHEIFLNNISIVLEFCFCEVLGVSLKRFLGKFSL